jgi:hypothetical protein
MAASGSPGSDYLVDKAGWESNPNTRAARAEGQLFHRFDSPNRFGLDPFYTLHVWRGEQSGRHVRNWNPNVSCNAFNPRRTDQHARAGLCRSSRLLSNSEGFAPRLGDTLASLVHLISILDRACSEYFIGVYPLDSTVIANRAHWSTLHRNSTTRTAARTLHRQPASELYMRGHDVTVYATVSRRHRAH